MEETKPNVAELVGRMPDSDNPGQTSKFTGPDPAMAEEVFRAILAGGSDALKELVALVKDPTGPDFKDFRPEYVLHGIAVFVGRPDQRDSRRVLEQVLVEEIGREGHSKWMLAFLLRTLQVAGTKAAAPAIGKHLLDDDLCEPAAMALVAIGDGAAEPLRDALPAAKGKNRATIAQALGVLRVPPERKTVTAIQQCTADPLREVRTSAAWALANIGDPNSVDLLLKAAKAEDGWERILGAKACLLLGERLLEGGMKGVAFRLYMELRDAKRGTDEAYLAEAAERGIAATGS